MTTALLVTQEVVEFLVSNKQVGSTTLVSTQEVVEFLVSNKQVGSTTLVSTQEVVEFLVSNKQKKRPLFIIESTQPDFDYYWNNVSVLLLGNGVNGSTNIVDSSQTPKTVTINNTPVNINTSIKKFGTGSIYFGNAQATNSITISDAISLSVMQGNYTCEFWFYPTGVVTNALQIRFSALSHRIDLGGSNRNVTYYADNYPAMGSSFSFTHQTQFTLNQWNHIALVRNNGVLSLYLNGVRSTTTVNETGVAGINNNTIIFRFGELVANYIDDFRFTAGVARYTTSTFNVPTIQSPTK